MQAAVLSGVNLFIRAWL